MGELGDEESSVIYEYTCKACGILNDVVKPVRELELPDRCPRCGKYMVRRISKGEVSFGTFRPGYYDAFGKVFSSKSQLTNEIRRINGESGRDIVEVGNDKFPEKPSPAPLDRRQVIHDYKRELKRGSSRR